MKFVDFDGKSIKTPFYQCQEWDFCFCFWFFDFALKTNVFFACGIEIIIRLNQCFLMKWYQFCLIIACYSVIFWKRGKTITHGWISRNQERVSGVVYIYIYAKWRIHIDFSWKSIKFLPWYFYCFSVSFWSPNHEKTYQNPLVLHRFFSLFFCVYEFSQIINFILKNKEFSHELPKSGKVIRGPHGFEKWNLHWFL